MAHVSEKTQETMATARGAVERSRERRTATPGQRHSIGKHSRAYKIRHLGQKLVRVALLWISVFVASIAWALIVNPLDVGSIISIALTLGLGSLLLMIYPKMPIITEDRLMDSDIAALPAKTEIWLESQRAALPAPAQSVVDGIGIQLDTLASQLQRLDPHEPAVDEVKRLVGEHLPGLVNGYKRVPPDMRSRRSAADGRSADQQLVDGLKVIETEIRNMSENIANGDLDALATRGRYLEIKYQNKIDG